MADAEVEDDRSEASRFAEHDSNWWEIPGEMLARCSAPFCFLEPEDFHYYLPAYMNWFLNTGGAPGSFSSEMLIYYLSDEDRGGRLAKILDAEQRSTVIAFLEHVVAASDLWQFHEHAKKGFAIWGDTRSKESEDR